MNSHQLSTLISAVAVLTIFGCAARPATFTVQDERELDDGAQVSAVILGDDSAPTPVRVRLTDLGGRAMPLPEAAVAVMYGMWDHADGYGYQPDSSFYVDGQFELGLSPGTYVLDIQKGHEYVRILDSLTILPGERLNRTYNMERWVDMPALGWYSADGHIHIRRSPREDPLLMTWIQAEDIHIGNLLRMGDFWEKFYSQYAFGDEGTYQKGNYLLTPGQEDPRTPELGHAVGLGASAYIRYPDRYYFYDLVFDGIHEHGGVGGYAHQAESFYGHRGLTLDGLRGKVDLVEVLQFCVPGGPLITDHYYDLLNLGFKVTATAGSDFPWCGRPHHPDSSIPHHENARIGNARFYVYVGDSLTSAGWREALRAGRTFASTGPMVLLEVEGAVPGSEVHIRRGDSITIKARALGHREQVPLKSLEIIGHGRVVNGITAAAEDTLVLAMSLKPERSMWIAARAEAGPMQVAHTTPIYVKVDGSGFHDSDAAMDLLDRSERHLKEIEEVITVRSDKVDHQAWRYREGLEERIRETRAVIERLRKELK